MRLDIKRIEAAVGKIDPVFLTRRSTSARVSAARLVAGSC